MASTNDNRRQMTIRAPLTTWRWIRSYHRTRRELFEQQDPDTLRGYNFQDSVIELLQAGLACLHPLTGILLDNGDEELDEELRGPDEAIAESLEPRAPGEEIDETLNRR